MSNEPHPPLPWQFRHQPALVAHRGFAQWFPENTLTAMAAAVDAGAAFLECDIQLSKDGVPFLMHDADLMRTAGIDKSVFDLTMQELATINVGEPERLGGRFNVRPTTLEQLCVHLNQWQNVHTFIEIKRQSVEHFGLETVMSRVFDAIQTLVAPFTILSFRNDVVTYTNAHTAFSTGWVIRDWNADSLAQLDTLKPEFVYCNYTKIPADLTLPEGPWHWVLYEITDDATAAHWRARGAAMIESMNVGKLLAGPLLGAP
ncbi:MAG: glycerophosphodiester phosphodiesterase family protein [Pseudomonadota bacterium]